MSKIAPSMRRRSIVRFVWLVPLCAAAFAACGGTTAANGGEATVDGTVSGQSVPTGYASMLANTLYGQADGGGTVANLYIDITNVSAWCADFQSSLIPPSASDLNISMQAVGMTTPLPVASYAIDMTTAGMEQVPSVSASYNLSNATCATLISTNAVGGTVTLTNSQADLVEGNFDLTFGSGDHLTGTFSAPQCYVKTWPWGSQCGS